MLAWELPPGLGRRPAPPRGGSVSLRETAVQHRVSSTVLQCARQVVDNTKAGAESNPFAATLG